jgi:hypothetical protein
MPIEIAEICILTMVHVWRLNGVRTDHSMVLLVQSVEVPCKIKANVP